MTFISKIWLLSKVLAYISKVWLLSCCLDFYLKILLLISKNFDFHLMVLSHDFYFYLKNLTLLSKFSLYSQKFDFCLIILTFLPEFDFLSKFFDFLSQNWTSYVWKIIISTVLPFICSLSVKVQTWTFWGISWITTDVILPPKRMNISG